MKFIARAVWVLLLMYLTACGGKVDSDNLPEISVAHQPEDLNLCVAPQGHELTDIESIVGWINAMQKPLTLACFVASLPRPFTYNATSSMFSAQPAVGPHNPRLFIQYDKLTLSFVPQERVSTIVDLDTGEKTYVWDADGIQLLEFSLEVDAGNYSPASIKGELAFPVMAELPRNAGYDRILVSPGATRTSCAVCHSGEEIVDYLDDVPVFKSRMLRHARGSEVTHAQLMDEYLNCNPEVNTGGGSENNEWYRCQMFDAFFGKGQATWANFRRDIETLHGE